MDESMTALLLQRITARHTSTTLPDTCTVGLLFKNRQNLTTLPKTRPDPPTERKSYY